MAVLDIGKTGTKLILAGIEDGEIRVLRQRPSRPREGKWGRALDLAGIEAWLLRELASLPERGRIAAIVPVTHGAAAVLLDADGEVVAAPDYEDPVFGQEDGGYDAGRDPFAATFSPRLPLGLNLGFQLHVLDRRFPERMARVRTILTYPQYWAWRLCGVMAAEATSLGCHTDLWLPATGEFSPLAGKRGWDAKFPGLRRAGEVLGPVLPRIAAAGGVPDACRVLCGLHDSNASYLCHLASRPGEAPFAVISSGTWTVVMARGAPLARLAEKHDMLANVDATGAAVPTARFMGGREYAAIAGEAAVPPDAAALAQVLRRGAMARPAFAPAGPFAGEAGQIVNGEGLAPPARAALASLYLALVSDFLLDALGATGPVIIDGPLAANPLYGPLLGGLRAGAAVWRASPRSGSVLAARHLVSGARPDLPLAAASPLASPGLAAARTAWRAYLHV